MRHAIVVAGSLWLALNPVLSAASSAALEAARPAPNPKLLPVGNVRIEDKFWAPKLKIYREKTIPHSWQYMAWELRALRRAAGEQVQGELNGTWGEANLFKFLETVAYSLALSPDPELERRADEVIALVGRAQRPDGYAHAYVLNSHKQPWDPAFLDGSHDGYVLGHMIEAAIAYQAATGKGRFLEIACKAADQACRHFLGPEGQPGFCGHAELELALVELYRVTGQARYLDLARAFIEWRGRGRVKPFSATPRAYFQDALPLRQQVTLEGHAVRAIFFASGVADAALETGDGDYRLAANRFWDSTTRRRMAVTGGIGPRQEHEAFGEDYELPNDGYYESCAACGLADFALRLFRLERAAECADVLERVLYNAVLHGISLSGTATYYQNPLRDRDHPRFNSWVCCPPNLSRTLLKLGRYAYACAERDLYVNLYVGGSCAAPLPAGEVKLRIDTEYPWDGQVAIQVNPGHAARFGLNLRLPGWCPRAQLTLNGERIAPLPRTDHGYLRLDREWRSGDNIRLTFEMPVERLEAHPNIRDCAGKVALQRGPIVYAFEGLDNTGSAQVVLGAAPEFRAEHRPDFLGGVTVVHGTTAEGKPCLAIPFYALANRDKSAQEVWVRQAGSAPNPAWWEGRLYRAVQFPLTK